MAPGATRANLCRDTQRKTRRQLTTTDAKSGNSMQKIGNFCERQSLGVVVVVDQAKMRTCYTQKKAVILAHVQREDGGGRKGGWWGWERLR